MKTFISIVCGLIVGIATEFLFVYLASKANDYWFCVLIFGAVMAPLLTSGITIAWCHDKLNC